MKKTIFQVYKTNYQGQLEDHYFLGLIKDGRNIWGIGYTKTIKELMYQIKYKRKECLLVDYIESDVVPINTVELITMLPKKRTIKKIQKEAEIDYANIQINKPKIKEEIEEREKYVNSWGLKK